jgi:hypothetical protein
MISLKVTPVNRLDGPGGSVNGEFNPAAMLTVVLMSRNPAVAARNSLSLVTANPK